MNISFHTFSRWFSFFLFSLFLLHPSFAQQTITVLDEHKQTLIGVNIYSADRTFAASTDVEGQFLLPKLDASTRVFFSYLSYEEVIFTWQELQNQSVVQLQPIANNLGEVVIVGRKNERAERMPYQIERIAQSDIQATHSSTSADALSDHAGVFVQRSQGGGGSPVLRGFEANKVLLVVDGVRMNNAIYRNGHLQNAITIDPAMLDQLEVIYGPGSLTYGSDALGGVIHFRTKQPQFSFSEKANVKGGFFTRYATANDEKAVHFNLNYGKKRWASLTSVTYSNFGDIEVGDNYTNFPNGFGKRPFYAKPIVENEAIKDEIVENDNPDLQVGTAYDQIDILQKLRFQIDSYTDITANIQYSTSSNVPRYDQLSRTNSNDPSDLRFAEWYYGPQNRLLAAVTLRNSKPTPFYDRALLIAAYQHVDEERFDRRIGRVGRSFQLENVEVVSTTLDLDKSLSRSGRHRLSYGLDWNFNDVQSEAGTLNLTTSTIERDQPTRYPSGGSRMNMLAAYGSYRWNSRDSVQHIEAGLRYTYVNTFSLFSINDPIQWAPDFYTDGVRNEDDELTWGIGWTALTRNGWQFRAAAASSFRAPNLDDFSKVRVNDGFVTIPNSDLQSERTLNGEMTIGKMSQIKDIRLQISGTAFYTYLQNAIVRTNFSLPDGTAFLELGDEFLTTQANVNAENAYVYGTSTNVQLDFAQHWRWYTNFNWTYGRRFLPIEGRFAIDEIKVPLAHIPPIYGRSSLRYQKDKWRLEGIIRYNGAKQLEDYAVLNVTPDPLDRGFIINRLGSADNLEETPLCEDGTYCLGTPAWLTYNFYVQYQFGKLRAQISVENITDVHYRPFASGLSAAGRNLIFGVSGNF